MATVDKEFSNVVHIQYMGPRFEQRSEKNYLQLIREVQGRGKQANRNSAVTLNIETLEILH